MSHHDNDFKAVNHQRPRDESNVPITGKIILGVQIIFIIGLVLMYTHYDIFKKIFQ